MKFLDKFDKSIKSYIKMCGATGLLGRHQPRQG